VCGAKNQHANSIKVHRRGNEIHFDGSKQEEQEEEAFERFVGENQ